MCFIKILQVSNAMVLVHLILSVESLDLIK